MKFYLMTDLHYYSKRNYDGDPYALKRASDQLQSRESEEIVREAFDIVLNEGFSDTVIIPGDLTQDADYKSHEDLVKIFKEYAAKGLRIIVTTATHDYKETCDNPFGKEMFRGGKAVAYDKDGKIYFVDAAHRDQIREYYKEFGREQAVSVHDFTMSYSIDLDDEYRLLALNDDFEFDPKTKIRGYDESALEWIKAEVERAKSDGKRLIAATHHPILPPSPLYKLVGPNDMLKDHERIAELFADAGVNLVFTGHTHMQDIGCIISKNGNPLYDVGTCALTGYKPNMRKVEIIGETAKIETLTIPTLSRFDLGGKTLPEYCRESFFGMLESMIGAMAEDEGLFAMYANGLSIRPHTVHKYWFIIKRFGKWINKLTIGKAYKWVRKESGLSKEDIKPVENEKMVPIFMKIVENMFTGNASLEPKTPEYGIIMGALAIIDSITKTLRLNLNKMIGYPTVSELLQPLVYNNELDDDNITIVMSEIPPKPTPVPKIVSKKGPAIVAIVIMAVLLTLPITIPCAILVALIIAIGKLIPKKEKQIFIPGLMEDKDKDNIK